MWAHRGEVQRRLLQVVGVVRVGAVLEQAAHLPRVKRADVMAYHAQRAGDALPLGYGAGQVTPSPWDLTQGKRRTVAAWPPAAARCSARSSAFVSACAGRGAKA